MLILGQLFWTYYLGIWCSSFQPDAFQKIEEDSVHNTEHVIYLLGFFCCPTARLVFSFANSASYTNPSEESVL